MSGAPALDDPALARVDRRLQERGASLRAVGSGASEIACAIDRSVDPSAEGYALRVGPRGVEAVGAGPAGLAHALRTLEQWLVLHPRGPVPSLEVRDAPELAERGAMLDVARDKVPTMETLFELVDRLAALKLNRLQLYMEASFAYPGHERVWQGSSPFTPDELRSLDAFCRARHVELVPNQQSFGHMHRWLLHEPYRALAECPEGVEHPFAFEREPFSLCPTDPRSLAFVEELFDALLPCFTSGELNVGLDETFDLGLGRSRAECEARGKPRVYLDFLRAVHERVAARGKRMQFWGDVVLEHPELVPELPRDAIAMAWGYEAEHPFERELPHFAASGLDFHVCPGTSSWNSVGGRTDNALTNLARAARIGREHGARGLLATDWGDRGHLQPAPVSELGWLAAADAAWNANAPPPREPIEWQAALDAFAFEDEAGALGRAAYELGRVDRATGARARNGTALFYLLAFAHEALPHPRIEALSAGGLERAEAAIDEALGGLANARSRRADGERIAAELRWAGDLLACAARLGRARLGAGERNALGELPGATRAALSKELLDLADRHRALWLARNRPGGLERSVSRLERVASALRNA